MILLDLGKQIRDKRKAEKLSAEELAKKLKVSAANIYKWEKGTKPSDPEDYIRLANWLKILETIPNAVSEPETSYGEVSDLSAKEIISVLSLALKNESEARKEQAETLKIQVRILEKMQEEMARKDIQATMDLNLKEVLAIVDKLSKGQNKAITRFLHEFREIRSAQAPLPVKGQVHPTVKDKRKLGDGKGA